MNIRLESMCHGDGKVYLQMVVDRLMVDSVLGLQATLADGTPLPSLLLPFHPLDEGSSANYVVVLPHLVVREVCLDFAEYAAGEEPVAEGHLTVELNTVKWRTRLNALVRNELVSQMLDIEREHRAGRMNVYFTSAIDDGDETVVKMLVDMPNVGDADVMVDFLDDMGHGFDLPVYPLVDEVVPAVRPGEEDHLHIGFSVRVDRAACNFCVKVYDAAGLVEGSFARFCDETASELRERTLAILGDASADPDYPLWFYNHRATLSELELQRRTSFAHEPLISLVMPLSPADREPARLALDALQRQSYDLFELVLVDGCPQEYAFDGLLSGWQGDPRLVRIAIDENTDDATRMLTGLMQARGSYRAILPPEVVLSPDALFELVRFLNEGPAARTDFWRAGWSGERVAGMLPDPVAAADPECMLVYANHDVRTPEGDLFAPCFKPVASPELLRTQSYLGPFVMLSARVLELVAEGPGFTNEGFLADLCLKAWELGVPLCRVERVLYHVQQPTVWGVDYQVLAEERLARDFHGARKAVASQLRRLGMDATVVADAATHCVQVQQRAEADAALSVVVPSWRDVQSLARCVESVLATAGGLSVQLVFVRHDAEPASAASFFDALVQHHPETKMVFLKGNLGFAARANRAAKAATGEYLLFLDHETEFLTPAALPRMVGRCSQPGVGVVGGKLLYVDDTIRHAGKVIGPHGSAEDIGANLPRTENGYLNRLVAAADVSAVSGACLLAKREAFDAAKGFDERFHLELCDADFCLRVFQEGHRVVFDPAIELYHHGSRSLDEPQVPAVRLRYEQERAFFHYRWPRWFVQGDPFLGQGLDPASPHFRLERC